MGRSEHSADVWARTYPGAYQLAFLLLGDPDLASQVAERTFVRMHVRYRDVRGGGLESWTTRDVVRLCRTKARTRMLRRLVRPSVSGPPSSLDRLRFRKRVAFVLSVYSGFEPGEVADALDCSPGGAVALLQAVDHQWENEGPIAPGRTECEALVAGLPERSLKRATLRRAMRARVMSSFAMVAIITVSVASGYVVLQGPSTPDVEQAKAIDVPGRRGPSDARSDLARFGAPGWCPDLTAARSIEGQSQGPASDAAIRFDIALAKGSYQRTVRALIHRSPGAPDRPRLWPHHHDSSGLGVIQISEGSADPDLVRACGLEVGARTLKVAVYQGGAGSGAGEVIAFYTMLTSGGWAVWASAGP